MLDGDGAGMTQGKKAAGEQAEHRLRVTAASLTECILFSHHN